jgi:hypothetical protein
MHMHLRELMFHHKVVDIVTLAREHQPTSKPTPEQASIATCSRRDAHAPPGPPATSSPRPADTSQRTPRTCADGEDLDAGAAVRRELRRPTRPSTEELLEACAPARYADRPAAAAPASPRGDLFIDEHGGDWAGRARALAAPEAGGGGISASVGELAHGGRFQPLVLT